MRGLLHRFRTDCVAKLKYSTRRLAESWGLAAATRASPTRFPVPRAASWGARVIRRPTVTGVEEVGNTPYIRYLFALCQVLFSTKSRLVPCYNRNCE